MRRGDNSARTFRAALDAVVTRQVNSLPKAARSDCSDRLSVFRIPVSKRRLQLLTTLLDRRLLPALKRLRDPIPSSIIKNLKTNYSEMLPKTMRVQTAELNTKTSKAWKAADTLGITDVLQSEDLRRFGERVTGRRLLPDPGCQIICYRPGDFSGPHTDHHPEDRDYRDGYVDIHIMLSSPTVASQLLIHARRDGMLDVVNEVGSGAGIAVYQLPFWHYTTPLIARRGAGQANRWLFLATYIIDRSSRRAA